MIDVLDRITQYRLQRNWTEYQLAAASGLTQSTISSWYRKKLLPTLSSLEKICDAFGITLSEFFMTEEEAFPDTLLQKKILKEVGQLNEEQQKAILKLLKTI